MNLNLNRKQMNLAIPVVLALITQAVEGTLPHQFPRAGPK
jgi:hypothetical protein